MSRQQHDLERGDGSGGENSKAAWDTGSSLYDSYELAAVRRLLDRSLLAVANEPELATGAPPVPAAERRDKNKRAVVVRARRLQGRDGKVTLRALFRAVASSAVRQRPAHAACACIGMSQDQSVAVEPVLSSKSHGKL
ncbi:hypothetical protein ACP70R_037869 [Stipagrostis hirtigluma subsp. patula]